MLGIGSEWNLWLRVADTPDNSDEADGCVALTPRYLMATITIRRGLSEERGREVIMHELLHVALARLNQTAHRLVDMVPETQREHALELYTDAEEATIETITRALQRGVKLKE